jgi:hypothetical protein
MSNTPTVPDVPAPDAEAFVEVLGDNSPDNSQPDPGDEIVQISQSKPNELIRNRMGKAGSEARARAAELERENLLLKEQLVGNVSDDVLEKTRGELAAARLESAAPKESATKREKDLLIAQEASKHGFIDVTPLQRLTRDNLRHTDQGFVPVDDAGNQILNPTTNDPLTVEEFFRDYGNRHAYLVRSSVKPGTGSTGSTSSVLPGREQYDVTRYFGPGSDASAANRLPREVYSRLRIEAKRRGLVG